MECGFKPHLKTQQQYSHTALTALTTTHTHTLGTVQSKCHTNFVVVYKICCKILGTHKKGTYVS